MSITGTMPTRDYGRRTWLLAGGVAALVIGWALAILAVEELRFAVLSPRAEAGVEAAAALARLFGALVLFLFPTDEGGQRLRWVAGGFVVLGLGGLVFGYLLPLVGVGQDLNTSIYASLFVRGIACVLFVLGLLPRTPPVFTRRSMLVTLAVFAVLGIGVVAGKGVLPPLARVPSLELAAVRGDVPLRGLTSWHWSLSLITLGLAVAAVWGALRCSQRGTLGGWLLVAMVLLAGSQLHNLFWPSIYSPVLTTADLLRLGFAVVVALGGFLELRRAQARYRTVVDTATDGIITTTQDGIVRSYNRGAERIFGYRADEVTGQPLTLLMPEGFGEPYTDGLRRYSRTGEAHILGRTVEVLGRREGGTEVPLELTVTEVREGSGKLFTGIMRDVSQRKRIELAMKQQSTMLRAHAQLLDLAHDAILTRDLETGTIQYWNQGAEEMYGWMKGEVIGKDAWALLCTRCAESPERIKEELLRTERWEGELEQTKRDGQKIVVSSRWALQHDEQGRPTRVLEIHTDITERKRVEAEREALLAAEREHSNRLRELAALKANFSTMVAHELGSPLAAVRRLNDVLATGRLSPEQQAQVVAAIDREIDALASLVEDVRSASTVEQDDFAVQVHPVPVASLVAGAVAFAGTLPGDHPFTTDVQSEDVVLADEDRIGQVLRNLLVNAARYSPQGTPIELRVRRVGSCVCLEVADHGYGIHPEDAERIFEKFGRGRDQSGKKVTGMGLGLYLSRRIVQAHGSDLSVQSELGSGSVFGFELEVVQ
ncbi:MAG: PAS domain S-box protein [Chloroflexota bacterium]|nr:PAS domain S-box protein [Chloroflexota bacterium]